jgi:hypothetical protein
VKAEKVSVKEAIDTTFDGATSFRHPDRDLATPTLLRPFSDGFGLIQPTRITNAPRPGVRLALGYFRRDDLLERNVPGRYPDSYGLRRLGSSDRAEFDVAGAIRPALGQTVLREGIRSYR